MWSNNDLGDDVARAGQYPPPPYVLTLTGQGYQTRRNKLRWILLGATNSATWSSFETKVAPSYNIQLWIVKIERPLIKL